MISGSIAILLRLFLIVLLAMTVSYLLNRSGTLHQLERLVRYVQLLAEPKGVPSQIRIVDISDDVYDDFFDGTSPLDPQKLYDLIGTIARSEPKLIAVDIDTSHRKFGEREFHIDEPTIIIWERDVSMPPDSPEGEMVPLDVLGGGRNLKFNRSSGIPALLDDPVDRETRFYRRCIETKAGPVPSFVGAITAAWQSKDIAKVCDLKHPNATRPFLIRYSFDEETNVVPARVLVPSGKNGSREDEQTISALKKALQGKLVLLGGSYRDFDRHFTLLGTKPGLVVLANALQTELDEKDKPIGTLPDGWMFVLEFLSGALMFVLFAVFSVSAVSAIIFGVACGILFVVAIFTLPPLWFASFAPTLIAVLILEIYEHLRHKWVLHVVHSRGRRGDCNYG